MTTYRIHVPRDGSSETSILDRNKPLSALTTVMHWHRNGQSVYENSCYNIAAHLTDDTPTPYGVCTMANDGEWSSFHGDAVGQLPYWVIPVRKGQGGGFRTIEVGARGWYNGAVATDCTVRCYLRNVVGSDDITVDDGLLDPTDTYDEETLAGDAGAAWHTLTWTITVPADWPRVVVGQAGDETVRMPVVCPIFIAQHDDTSGSQNARLSRLYFKEVP